MEQIIQQIKQLLLTDLQLGSNEDVVLKQAIQAQLHHVLQQSNQSLSLAEQRHIAKVVFSQLRGYGILDDFITDDSITEIMINGTQNIFVERKGIVEKTTTAFQTIEELDDFIQKIVSFSGKEVNQAHPIVDTTLKNGSRVNIVLPPVALNGPIVTIRKFSKQPMTVEKLIQFGAIDATVKSFLQTLVQSKYNIVVSGGTGSGKTTFLNALSNFIPKTERIITIEDSAELQIVGVPNLVKLEARRANSANAGAISMRTLIKSSLRMRPDRIVVGEVRGGEALDMLQAMNTGHDGSLSTAHANSVLDTLYRLETMVLMSNVALPLTAIRQQIASSVDIIIHLARFRDGSRKVSTIAEVLPLEQGVYHCNILYQFQENKRDDRQCDATKQSTHAIVGQHVLVNALKNTQKLHQSGLTLATCKEVQHESKTN